MNIQLRIINWFLNKYAERKKFELDEYYSLQFSDFEKLFEKKTIREVLWEMVFHYDIAEPINKKERYRIYSKLSDDQDNYKLFKSKYTKVYMAYFNAKNDEERNLLKGRMLELQDILSTMEIAKSKLDNWDEIERLDEKRVNLRKNIQENILTTNNS